ncbi:MAG: adenosylcobinamide amidohydrolase [Paenibacillaceae bacterium]
MIKVERLSGGYGREQIIDNISFEVHKGEFFALLGPNGSGKSTIFKLITGVIPRLGGEVALRGKPIEALSITEKARMLAVLSQEEKVFFDFTVEEIVMLGRYPHQRGFLKTISIEDRDAVERSMSICKVDHYRYKPFTELSGGEKQRVLLAKALAQEPQVLLLDEPTNHLDIRHTFDMLNLLKEWQRTNELTVFAILHDLNIASLYADRVALLRDGQIVEIGNVHMLRKEKQLEDVYGVKVNAGSHPKMAKPQLFLLPHSDEPPFAAGGFSSMFNLERDESVIHLRCSQPLRSISNGVIGEGLGWARHFCNFHVDKNYNCSNPQQDIRGWLDDRGIPAEETIGMMTAVQLEDMVMLTHEANDYSCLVVVTAGVGNAVDITAETQPEAVRRIGTINTMLFIDGHLTDGALVNAMLSASEAKTKAMHDMQIKDRLTGTVATGTSTDSLLIACTQRGTATPYAGSGTVIGKRLGQLIYQALKQAIGKYQKRMAKV